MCSSDLPAPPEPARALMTAEDYAQIGALVEKVRDLGLNELTVRRDDITLSVRAAGLTVARQEPSSPPAASPPAVDAAAAKAPAAKTPPPAPAKSEPSPPATTLPPQGPTINAPLNGTFYLTSTPNSPPFVKEGDKVKAGDSVCVVEAMKLFNQIKAPFDCKIVKLLAKHGEAVQKDQPLMAVEKL